MMFSSLNKQISSALLTFLCALALLVPMMPQASAEPTDSPNQTPPASAEPTESPEKTPPASEKPSQPAEENREAAEPATDTPKEMPWLDRSLSPEKRADLLIAAMNESQLIHMVHGEGMLVGNKRKDGGPNSIGYIPPIPELRVPALVMTDGPSGLRNWEPATQMPAPIAQASTWDLQNMYQVGKTIGQDCKDRGQDVLFGPGFNLGRLPKAGRTFEYYGEDPYLSGKLAAANVKGLQDQGIMATVKHFVANNQEHNRSFSSSNMDSRTLHEIYQKPFQIAVKESNPASAMCAYNKVNGVYACSNRETLIDDLRGRMDFKGFVVSDYPATHETTDLANGLSIELPRGIYATEKAVRKAIDKKQLTWDDVKTRVRETLVQMFRFGAFDHPWDEKMNDRQRRMVDIPVQRGYQAAQQTVEQGAVLMKNNGILPLKDDPKAWSGKRILIVGEGAKNAQAGGGSSSVISIKKDNFLDEFKKKMPKDATVVWKSAWNPLGIRLEAKKADLVIVVAKVASTELFDRLNLDFMPHMNNAVKAASRVNSKVIVVTQIPGPTLMPWIGQVSGVLNVWYPGAAGGLATTNLLFGKVNPSGRLPQTFPMSNYQTPIKTGAQYPGRKAGFESDYTEGIFIGYRWFDKAGETPAYPFGYGLSYTKFSYSEAKLASASGSVNSPVKVTFKVKNTGKVAGAVVPQIYVGKPSTDGLETAKKELGAFQKIFLQPGESKEVTLEVAPDQLSIFNPKLKQKGDFVVPKGTYQIYLADNVTDVKATMSYQVG